MPLHKGIVLALRNSFDLLPSCKIPLNILTNHSITSPYISSDTRPGEKPPFNLLTALQTSLYSYSSLRFSHTGILFSFPPHIIYHHLRSIESQILDSATPLKTFTSSHLPQISQYSHVMHYCFINYFTIWHSFQCILMNHSFLNKPSSLHIWFNLSPLSCTPGFPKFPSQAFYLLICPETTRSLNCFQKSFISFSLLSQFEPYSSTKITSFTH